MTIIPDHLVRSRYQGPLAQGCDYASGSWLASDVADLQVMVLTPMLGLGSHL